MSDVVVKSIFLISSALLYPTMVLLIGGFIAVVVLSGGFLAEARLRSRVAGPFRALLGEAARTPSSEILRRIEKNAPPLLQRAVEARRTAPANPPLGARQSLRRHRGPASTRR